ncbi:Uncharacterised protein [Vibrio cholerae]|nr:Uncharacterised protein [Vibrio cholerae]
MACHHFILRQRNGFQDPLFVDEDHCERRRREKVLDLKLVLVNE